MRIPGRSFRAAARAVTAFAAVTASAALACPTCGGSGPPSGPSIWPLVGLFMLVPWILAAAVTILIRREYRIAPCFPSTTVASPQPGG